MNTIVEGTKRFVIREAEKYRANSSDDYDFWSEHIELVYEEALRLADAYEADVTIVALGALLHDIALIQGVGSKADHHNNGARIAKEVLEQMGADSSLQDKVAGCVLRHRSSKNAVNTEELCVADADILAHFDNPLMLVSAAYKNGARTIPEVRKFMKETYEKDFADLSERTQGAFVDRYKTIYGLVVGVE